MMVVSPRTAIVLVWVCLKLLYVSGVRVATSCQHTKGVLSAYHLYEWQLELVNARSLTDTELA